MPLIQLTDIHKYYNKDLPSEVHALRGIDLTVESGDWLAIMGVSGSGKSTLLHIIGCLDQFDQGAYSFLDESIRPAKPRRLAQLRNQQFGIVLQDFGLIPEQSVIENTAVPLLFTAGYSYGQARKRAMQTLALVGIEALSRKPVNQLSGGQKQRVAIARAMVNNPSLLLADEPTGSLDQDTAGQIVRLFKDLNEQGKTVILVTHDPQVAAQCKRSVQIKDGKFVS